MPQEVKIIIIDDDPNFREMAKVILESQNYQVLEAEDGAIGLDLIKKHNPTFVLLDLLMDEVDTGVRLADEIARNYPKLPIVIVSSYAEASKQIFDTGTVPVKEYLEKPLDPDQLIGLVKKYSTTA
jgi:two-component system, OmpR family, response regulator VanR